MKYTLYALLNIMINSERIDEPNEMFIFILYIFIFFFLVAQHILDKIETYKQLRKVYIVHEDFLKMKDNGPKLSEWYGEIKVTHRYCNDNWIVSE